MSDEYPSNSESPSPSSPKETPLSEGHHPEHLTKGNQPNEFGQQPIGDIFTGGYKPEMGSLNPANPPQVGSGVPPTQSSSTENSKGAAQE